MIRAVPYSSSRPSFIDELSRGPEPVGFVLHGHGTGALKKAVREHLKLSPVIARSLPANSDEGGDASPGGTRLNVRSADTRGRTGSGRRDNVHRMDKKGATGAASGTSRPG